MRIEKYSDATRSFLSSSNIFMNHQNYEVLLKSKFEILQVPLQTTTYDRIFWGKNREYTSDFQRRSRKIF